MRALIMALCLLANPAFADVAAMLKAHSAKAKGTRMEKKIMLAATKCRTQILRGFRN
jgi:hypothetical protein